MGLASICAMVSSVRFYGCSSSPMGSRSPVASRPIRLVWFKCKVSGFSWRKMPIMSLKRPMGNFRSGPFSKVEFGGMTSPSRKKLILPTHAPAW